MNLEALIAMWGQSQGSSGYSGRSPDGQSITQNFVDILDAGTTLPGSESRARPAGDQFLTRALDTFAHQMNRAEISTQPLHELFFPKMARAFGERPGVRFSDAANSRVSDAAEKPDMDSKPGAFVIVLAKPSGTEIFDEEDSRDGRAAITAAFTGRRSGRDAESVSGITEPRSADLENYAPIIQVDDSRLPNVLDGVFGGAAALFPDDGELPGNVPGAAASGLPAASGLQPTSDMMPIEELLHMPVEDTSVTGAGEWESLLFVPMAAVASGHLENRVAYSAGPAAYSGGHGETTSSRPSFAAPAQSSASGVRTSSSPRQAVTRGSAVPLPSAPQTPVPNRESAVSAVLRRDFYETLQAVLPPRQNFLLLQLGEEKRLFVRDFFSPTDTLRQLGQIAKSSPFDLSDLHVVINGVDHGRLG